MCYIDKDAMRADVEKNPDYSNIMIETLELIGRSNLLFLSDISRSMKDLERGSQLLRRMTLSVILSPHKRVGSFV